MSKNNSFKKYLSKYKTTTIETHTSMDGGKYNIPDTDYDNFLQTYITSLQADIPLHLTERHPNEHCIPLIDFDFRYDIENNKRFHNSELISKVVSIYQNILLQWNAPSHLLTAYVFERLSGYVFESKSNKYYKDGFHIIFPDISISYNQQFLLRLEVIKQIQFNKVLANLPLLNDIKDIVDESVIQKNNWLMYGSSKPDLPPYQLTYIIEYPPNNISIETFMQKSLIDIVKFFSLHTKRILTHLLLPSELLLQTNNKNKTKKVNTNDKSFNDKKIEIVEINDSNDTIDSTFILLQQIVPFIAPHFPKHSLQMKTYKIQDNAIFINTNDHFCPFVNREHSRKNPPIYLHLNLNNYTINLRCYDNDCSHHKYPDYTIQLKSSLPPFLQERLKSLNKKNHQDVNDYDEELILTTNKKSPILTSSTPIIEEPAEEVLLDNIHKTVKYMKQHFPKNELKIKEDGHIGKFVDSDGENLYTLELEDKYCPIQKKMSDSVELVADISRKGFNLRSLENVPGVYGQIFPQTPINIPENLMNMIFVKNLTVNQTINNIYQSVDDIELLEFEEDIKIINIVDDVNLNITLLKSMNSTHYDIAKFIYGIYKDKFRCVNNDKGIWYQWNGQRWVPGNDLLQIKLSEEFVDYYKKARQLYVENGNKSKSRDLEHKIKKIDDLIKKLKTSNFKTAVMTECATIFYTNHKDFESKLNENPNLLGFNNGIYDLQSMEFRNGLPEDCITFNTNINYKPYVLGQNKDMEMFLEQILPDKEKRVYVLKFLASCLSGSTADETFNIWTGSGGNGKSNLIELIYK
jgi:hypothetical protein